jgi:hypothetical protein
MTSIFLAREFQTRVWATDLWVPAPENQQRIADAGSRRPSNTDAPPPTRLEGAPNLTGHVGRGPRSLPASRRRHPRPPALQPGQCARRRRGQCRRRERSSIDEPDLGDAPRHPSGGALPGSRPTHHAGYRARHDERRSRVTGCPRPGVEGTFAGGMAESCGAVRGRGPARCVERLVQVRGTRSPAGEGPTETGDPRFVWSVAC